MQEGEKPVIASELRAISLLTKSARCLEFQWLLEMRVQHELARAKRLLGKMPGIVGAMIVALFC